MENVTALSVNSKREDVILTKQGRLIQHFKGLGFPSFWISPAVVVLNNSLCSVEVKRVRHIEAGLKHSLNENQADLKERLRHMIQTL